MGLYIHIPFCVKKCGYCDFCSIGIGEGNETLTGRLVDCLIREMERYDLRSADTVFIGGGTPSILPKEQMKRLLKAVRESFGCQSAGDDELRKLGRIHTWSDFLESYELARSLGFDNINVDLMTAIPGQSVKSLTGTLEKVIGLAPEHVSVYSLIIEKGTPYYEKYREKPPLDEETDRELYELTCRMLGEAGYQHYEVSNYAKPGRECRHNLNYWHRGNYIGIGPAAASHEDGLRRTNIRDLEQYMGRVEAVEETVGETEELTEGQKLLETVYLGLRTAEGVPISSIKSDAPTRKKIEEYSVGGLLETDENMIRLTEHGFWLSDYIVESLM